MKALKEEEQDKVVKQLFLICKLDRKESKVVKYSLFHNPQLYSRKEILELYLKMKEKFQMVMLNSLRRIK